MYSTPFILDDHYNHILQIPKDILFEVVASILVCIFGIMINSNDLFEIQLDSRLANISVRDPHSMRISSHRGQYIFA